MRQMTNAAVLRLALMGLCAGLAIATTGVTGQEPETLRIPPFHAGHVGDWVMNPGQDIYDSESGLLMFNSDIHSALDPFTRAVVNQWIAWHLNVPSIPGLNARHDTRYRPSVPIGPMEIPPFHAGHVRRWVMSPGQDIYDSKSGLLMFNSDIYYALDPIGRATVNQWIAWELNVPSIPGLDALLQ